MTTRKAVTLSAEELDAIKAVREDGVLAALVGPGAARSESAALHALVMLGLRRVSEAGQEQGYAALAAGQDAEDRAYQQAMRARRRGSGEAA